MAWDAQTDVLVVGGGGGGLVAALAARESGAEVALVEKHDRLGGNTALSSGSVPGAGSRFQQAAGVEDSADRMALDIMRQTDGTAPEHLVRALARESGPLVEWMVDHLNVPLSFVPDLKKVGHSVPRTHGPMGRQGATVVAALEQQARDNGILVSPGNPVRRLLQNSAGGIAGAVIENGGTEHRIGARKVILATNGFGANKKMLRDYIPEIAEAPYFGHQGNMGEGIIWGLELGARLRDMGAYQGHASVSHPQGALMTWSAIERGGFLVNLEAERFVDESLGYSGCTSAVRAQTEHMAFVVFDDRVHHYLEPKAQDYRDIVAYGGARRGAEIEALGAACGLDGRSLGETLARYNSAAGGAADPFGRKDFGGAPLRPPFTLVKVTAGLFHTQGGLDVNANAQPLRDDGTAIENLYAVGGTAVGVSGADGNKGYCSANGLLAALGLGRIAGRHAGRTL
ncbi:MAG: FAD-dependent oxidoreductase [Rhodospirillaceae bacterium]|jgi:fumarate reductase flavoprotein subunit|nr:FAD-dependent oxidoreductase [Rhodospirillaceae bacterium]MBT3490872.1 FAD-dependent oxidoreductase [Rhodospirillaceae bacterium]MBT3976634.1 FAD-dependent oxidoreductase [Rhodospirillaceae bacterium]MBT4169963.1 FAD-dependent oxidoreductase [Rhodospirillaceae bacterium]MBT4562450.1 FAD-dependent oxidoreductase [Rhodospirillaceae bacterium]